MAPSILFMRLATETANDATNSMSSSSLDFWSIANRASVGGSPKESQFFINARCSFVKPMTGMIPIWELTVKKTVVSGQWSVTGNKGKNHENRIGRTARNKENPQRNPKRTDF